MRIFGAERITGLMERLGMEEDVPIEHGLVNRAIENAQNKVEGHNFDIRKNLLDYDDVMNQQRKAIYALRKQILEGRYVPELSEADKKKGKEPPPTRRCRPSRASTRIAEPLADACAPIAGAHVRRAREQVAAPSIRSHRRDYAADRRAGRSGEADARALSPVRRRHRRQGELKDRNASSSTWRRGRAASLIQQRERVLDLATR